MNQSRELESTLQLALKEHGFSAVVVATSEGLPLSSATNGEHEASEILAAVAPVVEQAAQRSSTFYGLQPPEEVVIRAGNQRMVCRFFEVGNLPLILVVVTPRKARYRRAMNRILRDVRQLLYSPPEV